MINKKEDLYNTYIENDNGELLELYLGKCLEFGFTLSTAFKNDGTLADDSFTLVTHGIDGDVIWAVTSKGTHMEKELTLADLKPIPQCKEVEWVNGDECLYMNSSEAHKFIGMDPTRSDFCYIKANCSSVNWVEVSKLSKPESPEEKIERERLEAGYDLYRKTQVSIKSVACESFESFCSSNHNVCFWSAIVNETNYRCTTSS